jgi:hypothetical protein
MRRGKRNEVQGFYIRLIGDPVPVVVAFTKSDLDFRHISGSEKGNYQYQDHARTRAYAQCEQLCRSRFRREARDVPAELVSGEYLTLRNGPWISSLFPVMPQYGVLINNLIVTTHKSIMGFRTTAPSLRWSSRGAEQRIAPTRLAWSVALRASRDINIQASIEYVVSLSTLISFRCFGFQYRTIS